MKAVFDFLRAALPWIAMGLLFAVFFARGAKKKKKEEQTDDYGAEGMCLGPQSEHPLGTTPESASPSTC